MSDFDRAATSVAVLGDDLRRRIYLFVKEEARRVSREETAEAVGISRKLAAFHLDKLVDRGLLTASFARPPGVGGPGAGRPSKLYERSGAEIDLQIPERNHRLLGAMLLRGVETQRTGESAEDAARRSAYDTGLELGEKVKRERRLRPPGVERTLSTARDALADLGFEPYTDAQGRLALRNCPFRPLTDASRQTVCGMNRRFAEGFLRGVGSEKVTAELEFTEGECCVKLLPVRG
jgi:predicted ArsR family transcriptional regulator